MHVIIASHTVHCGSQPLLPNFFAGLAGVLLAEKVVIRAN